MIDPEVGKPIAPRLNPNINVDEVARQFVETGRMEIDNFWDEATVESLHTFYNYQYPKEWWWSSSCPPLFHNNPEHGADGRYDEYNQCDKFRDNNINDGYIKAAYEFVHKKNDEGQFAYFFWRSFNDHVGDCICQECQATKWLSHPDFINWLNVATGNTLGLTSPFTIFTSRYSKGCFLNTHSDDMNGKLAFVFHLTKEWRPDWGGLFMAQDKERNVTRTIVPAFNKFVAFKIGDYATPHMVSQVADNVSKHRLALTGWYQ